MITPITIIVIRWILTVLTTN